METSADSGAFAGVAEPGDHAEIAFPVPGFAERVVAHWVSGTGPAGLLLLGLTPALWAGWPGWLVAAWLCLPVYMFHQVEEHDAGRFAAFLNELFGKGREVLGPSEIFLINVPVVWGVNAIAFGFALAGRPDAALAALYLVFLNGLLHVAQAVALGRPNPGIWTAVFLFLPLGAYGLAAVPADAGAHVSAALLIVILHAVIVLQARGKLAQESAIGA